MRFISHSQVDAALSCPVAFDLRYVGQMTGGTTLKPKAAIPRLRAGRAFHVGLLEYHSGTELALAIQAMSNAIVTEAAAIEAAGGVVDLAEQDEMAKRLVDILLAYAHANRPFNLTATEQHIVVPVMRGYRFEAYLDGTFNRHAPTFGDTDPAEQAWLYEAKLRKQFTAYDQVVRMRQPWWYAWAIREKTGHAPAGVVVEEIADTPPAPVRFNQDGTPSAVQSCTLAAYLHACAHADKEPAERTVAALHDKKWSVRHEVIFDERGLDTAGKQIRSAAQMISLYDRHKIYPIHNPSAMRCPGCAFREVCVDPTDTPLIDALFNRDQPVRDRPRSTSAGRKGRAA